MFFIAFPTYSNNFFFLSVNKQLVKLELYICMVLVIC